MFFACVIFLACPYTTITTFFSKCKTKLPLKNDSTLHPLQVWTKYLVVGDRRKDEDHPAGSNTKPLKNPWQSHSVNFWWRCYWYRFESIRAVATGFQEKYVKKFSCSKLRGLQPWSEGHLRVSMTSCRSSPCTIGHGMKHTNVAWNQDTLVGSRCSVDLAHLPHASMHKKKDTDFRSCFCFRF